MTGKLAHMAAYRPVAVIGIRLALAAIIAARDLFLLHSATTPEPRVKRALTDVESDNTHELLKKRQIFAPFIEAVFVQSETLTLDDPRLREIVDDLTGSLRVAGEAASIPMAKGRGP